MRLCSTVIYVSSRHHFCTTTVCWTSLNWEVYKHFHWQKKCISNSSAFQFSYEMKSISSVVQVAMKKLTFFSERKYSALSLKSWYCHWNRCKNSHKYQVINALEHFRPFPEPIKVLHEHSKIFRKTRTSAPCSVLNDSSLQIEFCFFKDLCTLIISFLWIDLLVTA